MIETRKWKILPVFMVLHVAVVFGIEPFTTGALGFGGAAIIYNFGKQAYCHLKECCTPRWTNHNVSGIEKLFQEELIGQHLVEQIVPKTVSAHLRKQDPDKALVFSFHGWTGSGKNYVADIIASHVYRNGIQSKFIHKYIAGHDFPHSDKIEVYKNKLRNKIITETNKCERSMFVFDEMEKMPPGVADVLKPFLDHHKHIGGINYRKNIFIFLSNTVGDGINREALNHFKIGKPRESITRKQMEKLLSVSSFNLDGGLKDSNLILAGLVDFFVPFLPMEKDHVKECIYAEMRRRGLRQTRKNRQKMLSVVNEVAEELEYFPANDGIFSTTGCKMVAKKLDTVL